MWVWSWRFGDEEVKEVEGAGGGVGAGALDDLWGAVFERHSIGERGLVEVLCVDEWSRVVSGMQAQLDHGELVLHLAWRHLQPAHP